MKHNKATDTENDTENEKWTKNEIKDIAKYALKYLMTIERLTHYGGLHYEKLHGDKEGLSSVRINDQYRIEFREILQGDETFAEVCSIVDLSNHYK